VHQQSPGLVGLQRQLRILRQVYGAHQRELVAVGAGELPPIGHRGVGAQRHTGGTAVLKEKHHAAAVIARQAQPDHILAGVHAQLGGQVVAQGGGLRLAELTGTALVHLALIREQQQLCAVGGLEVLPQAVALLELLLAGHPQGLGRDLLEIALPAQEQVDGVVLYRLLVRLLRHLVTVYDLRPPWHGVLLLHVLQLADDDLADAARLGQGVLQVLDLVLQGAGLRHPLEDVLLVDVPQLDLRHVLRLHLIDAEADHQVGDDLGFLLRLTDDPDGPVDIQQDALQALQKVKLFLFLIQDEVHPALDAVSAPGGPLLQDSTHAQHAGHTGDEDVEVAADGILQGCQPVQLGHKLVRVHATLQVDGQLQAAEVRLVAHIGDLLDLAGLHQLRHLVQNGLDGGGVGDLVHLDDVFLLIVPPSGADLQAAAAGAVNGPQIVAVTDDLAAGGKIRCQQRGGDIVGGVFQIGDGGIAHLTQIKAADLAGHAHGDALVGGHQHIGIGGGQQGGLLGGVVVVVHKVHGIAVQITEQLGADGGQLGLGVPAGGIGHVPGVHLAEVALAVHKGVQQGLVALGQADHGLVDGLVAVGVQAHGLAHDIGALGAAAGQQAHLVHGVQQLSVGGLEAVDLRDGAADDDRHGVGHIVLVQRGGDGLLHHRTPQAHHVGIARVPYFFFLGFLFCHRNGVLSLSKACCRRPFLYSFARSRCPEHRQRRQIFRQDKAQGRSHTLCMASRCNKVLAQEIRLCQLTSIISRYL